MTESLPGPLSARGPLLPALLLLLLLLLVLPLLVVAVRAVRPPPLLVGLAPVRDCCRRCWWDWLVGLAPASALLQPSARYDRPRGAARSYIGLPLRQPH